MNKFEVAKVLDDMGTLLELHGENAFRCQAYHKAAKAIENCEEPIEVLVQTKRLMEIPGIGQKMAGAITTLVETGIFPSYERLKQSIPEGLFGLMHLPGFGGKKIQKLHAYLGVKTIDEVISACQEGLVAEIPGFGLKTQEIILQHQELIKSYKRRILRLTAEPIAANLLEKLRAYSGIQHVQIVGSLRRQLETVGNLDFLAVSNDHESTLDWLSKQPFVFEVLKKEPGHMRVRLGQSIQMSLYLTRENQLGGALVYYTGSQEFNNQLKLRAKAYGLDLEESGLTSHNKWLDIPTEEEMFKILGLNYIPVELREGMGEIEAQENGCLPQLITEKDIRGVFHCHTTDSDGLHSLEAMAKKANDLGWEYIGISDHSQSSYQVHGLDEERLFNQMEAIERLNQSGVFSTHVFKGLECDILLDGAMDFSDSILKKLDFVIASVHSGFKLDEETMTARLIKAIENPYTTIIGHLTGRLLLRRPGYAVNIPKIIDACIANKKIIELNASPFRLDMDWRHWVKARGRGLVSSINPDAHATNELLNYRLGVQCARKGWLEKADVLNTYPLTQVKSYLQSFR